MKPILLISSNPEINRTCSHVLEDSSFADVHHLDCTNIKTDTELIDGIRNCQTDVVIARDGKKAFIEKYFPHLSVIPLRTTIYDLLQSLHHASMFGSNIALIGADYLLKQIALLEKLLAIKIFPCRANFALTIQRDVDLALDAGAKVLIGGYSILRSVRLPESFPVISLGVDKESVIQSIEEARRLNEAISGWRAVNNQVSQILAHSSNGVIAVDASSIIKAINPVAQSCLQVTESQAIGRFLDELCPQLSLMSVIITGKNEHDILITYKGQKILCDKIAVKERDFVEGAILIFQDVNRLHRSEATVRRKIAMSGMRADKNFKDIVGSSPPLLKVIEYAKKYSQTDYTILIYGESGTGKELFAQSIHNHSLRKTGPFVAINCAAMPPTLLESELFGYESGAFTGASSKGKPGMLELAHGGTLFLDEIGELDLALQGKLLRVLQEKKLIRLGGSSVIPVNIRLIAATNRNLYECLIEGSFRKDLFYRINVLRLTLPPLRNIPDSIPLLAEAFLKSQGKQNTLTLGKDALKVLMKYEWPGNIRELENFMERIVALHEFNGSISGKVVLDMLKDEEEMIQAAIYEGEKTDGNDLKEIHRVLSLTKGNYTQASKILGISRTTLWRKLKKE